MNRAATLRAEIKKIIAQHLDSFIVIMTHKVKYINMLSLFKLCSLLFMKIVSQKEERKRCLRK